MARETQKFAKGITLPRVNPSELTNVGPGDMFCDDTDGGKIKQFDPTTSTFQSLPKQTDVATLQANDMKVRASTNDTTGNFLSSKLSTTAGKIVITTSSPGGNEVLNFNIGADVFDKTTNTTDNIVQGVTNRWYSETLFNTSLASKTTNNLAEGGSNLYFTDERVDDRVAALLNPGVGVKFTYDDPGNSFKIEQVINNVAPVLIPEGPDRLLVHDESAGEIRAITRDNFLAGLPVLAGVPSVYRFNINGNLSQITPNFAKRLDGAVVHNAFTPATVKLGLTEGGRTGNLKVDIRHHRNVNVPIEDITPQFDSRATLITNIAPAHPTQSIARSTAQVSTQSITRPKPSINIEQVIIENGNARYTLASAPDSDWAVGDSVLIDQSYFNINNGTFTILSIGSPAYPNSILTSNTAGIAELIPGGNDNAAFLANFGTANGTAANVSDTAIQADGKILVVGNFTVWNGLTRNRMVRLNADGTEDTAFYTNLGTGFGIDPQWVTVQPDQKIIVTGNFTTLNGVTRNRIVRLNTDGTIDSAFMTNVGTGFAVTARETAVDSAGNIYVCGDFTTFNGLTRNRIVRLLPTGVEDTAWYTTGGTGFNSSVYRVKIDSSDRAIFGGDFTSFNAITGRNKIARLLPTGAYDTSFAPTGLGLGATANQYVWDLVIQADGKIVIGGLFLTYNAVSRPYLMRLNSDGTEDTAFSANLGNFPNSFVYALHIMNNGKILVGGNFTNISGTTQNYIALLESTGALDPYGVAALGSGFNNYVYNFNQDAAGNIVVGGLFTTYLGATYNRFFRFKQSLIYTKGRVNLHLYSYNYPTFIEPSFVLGENALFAAHTSANNNGNKLIYKINQSGNNIWVKNPTGVIQTTAVGNANVNRWKYATSVVPSNSLVLGEKAKMASHSTAANNGNFFIRAIENNGVTVYNEAGVVQAGVAGNINTNRWTYFVTKDPQFGVTAGDLIRMANFSAVNNGNFTVLAVSPTLITIYNEAGLAQIAGGNLGEVVSERKILRFATNQASLIGTTSIIELTQTQDTTYYSSASKHYQVLEVNRGGGFNAVIAEIATTRQLGKQGFVEIESRSIFTTVPTVTGQAVTSTSGRKSLAGSFGAVLNGNPVPTDTYLGLWITENFTDNVAYDLSIVIS